MQNADLVFYGEYPDSEFHNSTYVDLMRYKLDKTVDQAREKSKERAKNLSKMYYTLLNCIRTRNSDDDYLSEYRYQYQRHRMLAKAKWYEQIWDGISWAICGFGEKLGRFIITVSANIVFFALLYMFIGLKLPNGQIQYTLIGGIPVTLSQFIKDFIMCIHFSVVTLLSSGYGNIEPLNMIGTFICTIQIIIGIIFIAILTSIILKKLIR